MAAFPTLVLIASLGLIQILLLVKQHSSYIEYCRIRLLNIVTLLDLFHSFIPPSSISRPDSMPELCLLGYSTFNTLIYQSTPFITRLATQSIDSNQDDLLDSAIPAVVAVVVAAVAVLV